MGKKIQCIGRYVMEGISLGKGTFARVELAAHEITAIKVAIKVIDTRKIKEEYIRVNLYREARIMAHLRHPNIIRLYETLRATTLYCLVTEYAAGGELLAHIKSQESSRLTESAARPFIRQLVSALHYLHERNVIHRDLKMENIMLDEKKKHVKLIDFGLSAVWKESEPLKTHCGSPEYAAPELFVVGKTYGPEIDIWSFGIITYAMTIGKLPFSTPFRDEYQRQRMLQQIQKGLSTYHDREMQILTPDCRTLLHQLIEPNPELRIPLSEVEKHPWLTRNGKYPFCPYHPPPKDKLLHHQAVAELAFMRGLKRNKVEEEVRDHRGNDLSAMYNMIMDEKKKKLGLFDHDHTTKKVHKRDRDSRSRSRERDKLNTPEGRGKDIRTKGGVGKKVPKSSAGKAGAGSKAKPKNLRHSSMTSQPRDTKSGSGAQVLIEGEVQPEPPALSSPKHKPTIHTPGGTSTNSAGSGRPNKDTPTANGPTRIPLSQRRQPPPKLNLTLDLSIPHSLPSATGTAPKKPLCVSNSVESRSDKPATEGSKKAKQGIEASSGVPPRLSPAASKIPVASPTKPQTLIGRLERHLPAPCRPSSFQHTLRSPWHKATPVHTPADPVSNTTTGPSTDKDESLLAVDPLVAPRATPEDSLIDSYSTSSEEDRAQLCQLLEERDDFCVEDDDEAATMHKLTTLKPPPTTEPGRESPPEMEPCLLADGASKATLVGSVRRPALLLTALQSSGDADSGASSQFSPSATHSHFSVQFTGSGSSLPASFHPSRVMDLRTDPPRSDSAPADSLLQSAASKPSSLDLSAPRSAEKLGVVPCTMCGVSPSSPAYADRHSKFCHTGAHALDVFFSPDDELPSPTGPLWRPVASTVHDSPTRGRPLHSPLFGSLRSLKRGPMQVASVEGFTDDEYESEDMDPTSHRKPLIPQPHKCHSPTHIPSAAATTHNPHSATHTDASNAKRTAPSKHKSKSASTASSKSKRLSKNGVYSAIPDSSTIRLDPSSSGPDVLTSSSSSSLLRDPHADPSADLRPDADPTTLSSDKLATTSCNAAKVHPLEKANEDDKSFRSRIPRPSSRRRFGRLQVLSLLHPHDKHKDRAKSTTSSENSQNNSPKSTPERIVKSDTDRLLRQYDPKSKQYSWKQGLSNLLRIHHRATTNSNNNLAPARSKRGSSNNSSNNRANNKGSPARNNQTANSVTTATRKLSAENNSNHGNKSRKGSKEVHYQELDNQYSASPTAGHKCNSLQVSSSSSPAPSTCPSHNTSQNAESMATDCLHGNRGAKPRRVGWKGCKECAKSDHSSDEGPDMSSTCIPLEDKHSLDSKEAMIPNSNNIQKMAPHMTSHV